MSMSSMFHFYFKGLQSRYRSLYCEVKVRLLCSLGFSSVEFSFVSCGVQVAGAVVFGWLTRADGVGLARWLVSGVFADRVPCAELVQRFVWPPRSSAFKVGRLALGVRLRWLKGIHRLGKIHLSNLTLYFQRLAILFFIRIPVEFM